MTESDPRPLVIVGAGPLGMTMGRLFASSSHLVPTALVSRTESRLSGAAKFTGVALKTATRIAHLAPLAHDCVVLLATADRDIAAAAQELAQHVRAGQIVFHCSGALDSGILKPCADAGAAVASAHPMTSFADPQAVLERFAGVFCAIEGDAAATPCLKAAFEAIGANVVSVDRKAKILYHAGAVLASGYLVAVIEAALKAQGAAGIELQTAKALLHPLILTSLHNAMQSEPRDAMSGPLVRGDDAVTKAHFDALQAVDPALARLYGEITRYAAHVLGRDDPLGR